MLRIEVGMRHVAARITGAVKTAVKSLQCTASTKTECDSL